MTKQLTDDLVAVSVPEDAYDFSIEPIIKISGEGKRICYKVTPLGDGDSGRRTIWYRRAENVKNSNDLNVDGWEIVGTVTDGVPDNDIIFVAEAWFLEWLYWIMKKNACHTGKWVIVKKVNS